MRRLLLSLMLCYSCLSISAQSTSPFFYQLFADYGLSSDKTTVSLQDYKGFLWFGTEEGLNRMTDYGVFDIYRYDRTDTTTLSNDYVTMLFEDSQNRFWVGTRDGLNLYNRATRSFKHVPLASKEVDSSLNTIYDIEEDVDGDLWLISNDRIVLMDGNSLEIKHSISPSEGEGKLRLNDIAFYQTNLWVGTSRGLYELRGKMLKSADILKESEISSLLSMEDYLWLGTRGEGLFRYNTVSASLTPSSETNTPSIFTNDYINDISLIDEEEVWVATMNGINIFDLEANLINSYKYEFDNAFSLSDWTIREVYQDASGSVWMTTPKAGVNYYHKADNLFGYIGQSREEGSDTDLMDYNIFSIAASQNGKVWIGSTKGVSQYDPLAKKFQHYPFGTQIGERVNKVLSIAQCSAGFLWLGTNDGLVKWTGAETSFSYIMPEELQGLEVLIVTADEDDNLWLGTANQGVKLYSSVNKVLREIPFFGADISFSGRPKINDIKKVGGKMFVATEKGLFEYLDGALVSVSLTTDIVDLSNNIPVNTLFNDAENNLWLGTQQDGLLKMNEDGRVINRYNKDSGLKSDDIRSIVQDSDGNLWLSTNNGISKLSFSAGKNTTSQIRNYDVTDGIQGSQFTAQAGAITNDGQILMGGLSGVTIFRPDDIKNYQTTQKPTFIGLTVNGEKVQFNKGDSGFSTDVSMLKELSLDPDQNDFTLSFSALDYLRPDDVVYRYKLEGYDQDWIEQKYEGKASYKNIPADQSFDFVFQSKGRLSSEWSKEARLTIKVAPRYYQTFWFKSLLVIAGLLFIFLILWLREKWNIRKRNELELLINARSSELRKQIVQREEVEEALLEALVLAEDANKVKNNFLANMSHEIRTPLNGIIGLTEMSLDNSLDEDQKDTLRTISSSATALKLIVDDILDIAKIESGKLEMSSEPFSVKDLLHDVVRTFKIAARKKDISVKYWVLPDVPPSVIGDPRYVRQVITNLISNAIKFTHEGGVSIFAEALSEKEGEMEIWFTVTDTGIGISKDAQEIIFDRFVQNDDSNTRQYGGTGLGLSISKELVTKMGGDMWVESKQGQGSIFKFYIKSKEYLSEGQPKASEKYAKPVDGQSNGKGTILLVEDNLTNQKVALKMLANKGMSVTCVENGQEAIDKLGECDFDLILMDLQMPVMDGYEATRLIRAMEGPKANIPIIALTAAAMVGEREKCIDVGMNEYLTKPVSYKTLIDTVNAFLAGSQTIEAS